MRATGTAEAVSFGGYTVLTSIGTAYDAVPISRGLGLARIDFDGVQSIEFGVRCNKIGTGTLTFQLWNETNGAQIAAVSDASAAGDNKTLTTTQASIPTPGFKTVRVRAMNSVGTVAPVYYGAYLLLYA